MTLLPPFCLCLGSSWGLRYIDDLVLRDRDTDGALATGSYGLTGSGLDERVYALQDANWNVVALANTSGAVQERYAYSAYGTCQFLNASFASLTASVYDRNTLYTGRALDDESGLYYYRMRYYHAALGAFVSRDPIGLDTELNSYQYVSGGPANAFDPTGQVELRCCACCVDEIEITNVRKLGIVGKHNKTGIELLGNQFSVELKLSYYPSEHQEPCWLYWGENSSVIANLNFRRF